MASLVADYGDSSGAERSSDDSETETSIEKYEKYLSIYVVFVYFDSADSWPVLNTALCMSVEIFRLEK